MAGVEAWVFWWEAVVLLDQSFPLGLLAARATTWRHLVKGARTLAHLASLPGAARWVVVIFVIFLSAKHDDMITVCRFIDSCLSVW